MSKRERVDSAVQYHCYDSCNKCSGRNEVNVTALEGIGLSECKTKCTRCGFTDYWAYGFFESGQRMESKCAKYSFEDDL